MSEAEVVVVALAAAADDLTEVGPCGWEFGVVVEEVQPLGRLCMILLVLVGWRY